MSSHPVSRRALEEREALFYAVIVLITLGHALAVLLDLAAVKLLFGLPTIGYAPGALLIRLLFHGSRKLTTFEKIVLSVVFSLVLSAGMGLLLNMLPKKLSPTTINLALWGLVALLVVFNLAFRKGPAEEIAPPEHRHISLFGQLKARLSKAEFLAYSLIVVIALACLALLAYLLLTVESGEQFTEFYILGSEGLAEGYPREVVAGETIAVTAGITNREGLPVTYHIEVGVGEQQIGEAGPVILPDGETWEDLVQFVPRQPGADQKVEFLLYKDADPEPYRSLYLWLNVTAE